MNLRGFKVKKAILVFLITLTLGLGAAYFVQQVQVIGPLLEELESIEGIEEVSLRRRGLGRQAKKRIRLKINNEVPIAMVFGHVQHVLEEAGGEFVLQVEDSANPMLWEAFQSIQIPLEEAIMTGRFTLLEEEVKARAENLGTKWALALDRQYIYLVLENEDGVLQRIISRGPEENKIQVWAGGAVENEQLD
ncbi:MAG: hypothetical protein GX335_07300 [Firmicutes bacterium]|nr:hypothetical protein [Bacillota bacterium]